MHNRVDEHFVEVVEGLLFVEEEAERIATQQENACQRNQDELERLHNDWQRVNMELANIFNVLN